MILLSRPPTPATRISFHWGGARARSPPYLWASLWGCLVGRQRRPPGWASTGAERRPGHRPYLWVSLWGCRVGRQRRPPGWASTGAERGPGHRPCRPGARPPCRPDRWPSRPTRSQSSLQTVPVTAALLSYPNVINWENYFIFDRQRKQKLNEFIHNYSTF